MSTDKIYVQLMIFICLWLIAYYFERQRLHRDVRDWIVAVVVTKTTSYCLQKDTRYTARISKKNIKGDVKGLT